MLLLEESFLLLECWPLVFIVVLLLVVLFFILVVIDGVGARGGLGLEAAKLQIAQRSLCHPMEVPICSS